MAGMLEYKCPCCDGAIKFDSTTQKLKCPYCDTEFEVDALKGYDEDLKDAKPNRMNWTTPGGGWAEGETAGLHTYAFDWTAGALRWYVDNTEVFSVSGGTLPTAEGYIVSDVWAATPSVASQFGSYSGTPTRAYFDSIAFEAIAAPVPEPTSLLMLTAGAGLLTWRRRREVRDSARAA